MAEGTGWENRLLTHRRSIVKLTLVGLIILALGYGGLFFVIVRGVLLHEVDEASDRLAAPILAVLRRPAPDGQALEREIARYPLAPGEYLSVRDAAGRDLGSRGEPVRLPSPLLSGGQTLRGTPAKRLVVTSTLADGELRGRVVHLKSLDEYEHTLEHVIVGLAVMIPLNLLLALGLAFWLARRLARPVEEALLREQQFTRDASHELRTPLALILAQTQLVLSRPELGLEVRQKLEQIERSALRLKDLVHDLLILGRNNAGLGGEPLRFSLVELLDEALEAVEPLAQGQDIEVLAGDLPAEAMVMGSPPGLSQVLHNLLSNALHYSPRHSRVRVRLQIAGARALLSISNPGPGIPPADQERVFERFVRLDHGRAVRPEGTGLGLAIARAITRAHGGDLMLSSSPQEGTTFTLSLPLG